MTINTNNIISTSEANQNFSRVTRMADTGMPVIIFKQNRPKYLLIDIDKSPDMNVGDYESIDEVAARILKKYKPAFEELAK